MGEPQCSFPEPLDKSYPHLRLTASGRTLKNTVFLSHLSVHSRTLLIIEWNIIPTVENIVSVSERAGEICFVLNTVREISQKTKRKNQRFPSHFIE